jgi:hypothetical protein
MSKKAEALKKSLENKSKNPVPVIKLTGLKESQGIVDFIVLDEFKNLIPPLSEQEAKLLESSLLSEGCREPLIIWDKSESERILIDGHNRYAICSKHNIPYRTVSKKFESSEAAYEWILNNQFARRNLTKEQAAYLRGKKYSNEKNKGFKGNQYKETEAQAQVDKIAAEHGVSTKTIRRDEAFAQALDLIGSKNLVLRNDILSGAVKVKKKDLQAVVNLEKLPPLNSVEDLLSAVQKETSETSTSSISADELKAEIEDLKAFLSEQATLLSPKTTDKDLQKIVQRIKKTQKIIN